MRKIIIAGNWKLNKTIREAIELVEELKKLIGDQDSVEIVVAPVFTALSSVAEKLNNSNIKLSAQDLFWAESGAFTGEVSATLLKDVGCDYVIIGHSERRQFFGETNETVNKKVKAALAQDLKPIICVGEMLADRESGNTATVIEDHVINGIDGLTEDQILSCVIAYEPVWAIGTGKVATTAQAQEVHAQIRSILEKSYGRDVADQIRIQYGGSVKPNNAKDLLDQPDIDGALVGGASLKADLFFGIIASAKE